MEIVICSLKIALKLRGERLKGLYKILSSTHRFYYRLTLPQTVGFGRSSRHSQTAPCGGAS